MKVAVLLHSVPRRGKGGRCFKRPGGRLLVLIMPGSQFPVCVRLHGRAPYGYDEEADWDSHLSDVPSSQISSVDYLAQVHSLCASVTAVYLSFFVFGRVLTRLD